MGSFICGMWDVVPWPGIESRPLALGALSLYYWTTGEVPTQSQFSQRLRWFDFPVVMYGCELDYKESWALKNWCFWTVVLEKTLESPLDCKESQPVHPKGDQSCVFIGRTDAEAETPILWPHDVKNWLIWKDPNAGKDWGQEEKGMTGWDGWKASLTHWTRVWASSGSWWSGIVQSIESQTVGHDWVTELNRGWFEAWLGIYEGFSHAEVITPCLLLAHSSV